MNIEEEKFQVYLTTLRFLVYKVTKNLRRIYMDVSTDSKDVILYAYYVTEPTELELELLDDICTNSEGHLPGFKYVSNVKLFQESEKKLKHDFTLFATYD